MTPFTKGEEERHDNYQRKLYETIQHNQRRRMQLQSDFQSHQRNHRLSRAAWLQGRWLEISEQERRAQIHNQKLLQDFQRAHDTLNDMLAHTEAMNSIRVQYEQYLEENFTQWEKRLKDIRVPEKSKRVQQHSNSFIQQMKEDEGMKTAHRSDFKGHPLSSNSPNPSQTSHTTRNTQTAKDITRNAERCNLNDHHPYFPPTWLTGSQPFISGLPQNNIPKDYKNLQNFQALNHPLPPYYSLPGDSLHQSHSPVQQKSPSMDNLWAGTRPGFMPTAHFTAAGASWPRLPVLSPMMWGMMDVPDPSEERIQCSETNKEKVTKETVNPNEESCQRLKRRKNGKESDRSELDCRPVRLSIDKEESSEGSAVPSEVTVSGMQKRGKKKRDGTKSCTTENENNSQGSSTMPQHASDSHPDPKISKKHQKTSKKYSSKESIITKKNVDVGMQDEEEDEREESGRQEILPSSVSSEKKDGSEGLNIREEEYFEGNGDRHVAEVKICDREIEDEEEDEEGTGVEEEAGLDDEEGSEKVMGKRDGIGEPEGEGDVPDDIPDSEDGGETTEEEERENSFQDEKEARKSKGSVEDDKNVNTSDRDFHKSVEELYADETEEEEANKLIDEEEDEVVVEKVYPWRPLVDDHTKFPDDEDDDIEGLLNPVNSQTQKEDDVEETHQSIDQHSGSEEENLPQKNHPAATNESVESDDEFDHFYD
ncbi:uncharacterized protein LOC143757051 [Siphateles boraxobius]|uniref:uncharacterized protein LOC143757051 n=1 Tax=Siphateles boraxobius TaxID=180520 RepID=UPI004062F86A